MNNQPIDKNELERLYAEGNTMHQISKIFDCSVGKIYNWFHRYELIPKTQREYADMGRHVMSDELKSLLSTINKGKTLSALTRKRISERRRGQFINPTTYGGHKKLRSDGYIAIYKPNHKFASKKGYVMEHILVYEQANNCIVDRTKYCIHHINGIRSDNRVENLRLMTHSEHMSYHSTIRHQMRRGSNGQ